MQTQQVIFKVCADHGRPLVALAPSEFHLIPKASKAHPKPLNSLGRTHS